MVNWSDTQEIMKDAAVFEKLLFVLFGIYLWELTVQMGFEWSFITGRRSFRWPLVSHPSLSIRNLTMLILKRQIFYFLCRYCMLSSFIGLIISLTVTSQINCHALFTFNSWAGNMTIGCASTSLMLRTIALWNRKKQVVAVLGILCLAHWTLLYRTMFIVVAEWSPVAHTCVVVQTSPKLLNTVFFFTMAFDFIILMFTAAALYGKHTARTDLWKLLFHDGLVYFLISFSMNCIPAVLNVLNLNMIMNVVATVPAAMITAIASCRAVVRLMEFSATEAYVHDVTRVNPQVTTKTTKTVTSVIPRLLSKREKSQSTRPEVHVTTEHITMAEFPYDSPGAKSGFSLGSSDRDSTSAKDAKTISDKDMV